MNLHFVKKTIFEEVTFLESVLMELHSSRFWRYVLVFLGIYFIAVVAILRANEQFNDDLVRSFSGKKGWDNWSRYLSVYLSVIIHGNTYLTDMAPMPQFLCLFLMSLASAIIVCAFTDQNKFRFMHIVAVLPLMVSPYFLHCISYRYDSPYMGLSVLACVFPFLFIEKSRLWFGMFSILGLFVMTMTYQASSGIYLVMVLFWGLKTYLFSDEFEWRKIFGIILFSAALFAGTLGLYKIFLVHEDSSYVSTYLAVSNPFATFFQNTKTYIKFLRSDLPVAWKYCILLMTFLFFFNTVIATKRNRLVSAVVVMIIWGCGFIASYGAYLALVKPLFLPRAMYGFGAWIALFSLIGISALPKNIILNMSAILLSLWFIGYANLYGNALAEQIRYTHFRAQLILNDLNQLAIRGNKQEKIVIAGTSVLSPAVRKWQKQYPILSRKINAIQYLRPSHPNTGIYFDYYFAPPNMRVIGGGV